MAKHHELFEILKELEDHAGIAVEITVTRSDGLEYKITPLDERPLEVSNMEKEFIRLEGRYANLTEAQHEAMKLYPHNNIEFFIQLGFVAFDEKVIGHTKVDMIKK